MDGIRNQAERVSPYPIDHLHLREQNPRQQEVEYLAGLWRGKDDAEVGL